MTIELQSAAADHPSAWGAHHAHDPTVVRGDDGLWYMFSTDAVAGSERVPAGVHVRTSPDLVEWTFRGTALDGVPDAAREWSGAAGVWAPEVVRWPTDDGSPLWHMYYSASTFGSRTSAIGLAVATALTGPWTDRGVVVATRHGLDAHNAIDAAVVFDRAGTPWLTYGSFFGGIHTLPLSLETGLQQTPGETGTLIARRPESVDTAVEGAYIVYRPEEDRFVLFVSYDSLFSSYNVRVAVSNEVDGPYLDVRGNALTDVDAAPEFVGTKILGGYRFAGDTGWAAPGHNSIFSVPSGEGDGSAALFMVHHVRLAEEPSRHLAQIRRVHFTSSGWPVVSPQPFAGFAAERVDAPEPADGVWNIVRFDPAVTDVIDALPLRVSGDAASAGEAVPATLVVHAAAGSAVELDAVVFGSWDPVAGRAALSFSGIDADGVVWSGTKAANA